MPTAMPPLLKSMRPAQWAKNVFVLAPLVFAHRLTDPEALRIALLAFAGFCCAASAVYLLNDIRDREADRNHPLKRHRPLAAGTLSVGVAATTALILALLAGAASWRLGSGFALCLGIYLALNAAYSWGLKHVVILDVMAIAAGFLLRVLAGAMALDVAVSRWLLLCTLFLSLFLAFSKRRHEITLLSDQAAGQRRVLSHYSTAFLDPMINVVTASALISYALYTTAPETVAKYGSEKLVYTVPIVLYGIFRYLYLTYQRADERNPTEAMLTDRPLLATAALWVLAVVWIVYGGGSR